MVIRLLRRCAAPGAAVLLGSILLAGCDSASGSKEAAGDPSKTSPPLQRVKNAAAKAKAATSKS
jgi:hypothetical protein